MSAPSDMFENVIKIYYVTDSGEVDEYDKPIYTRTEISKAVLDILPGEYLMFEIDFNNAEKEEVQYKLMFDSVIATYPSFDSRSDYSSFICDLYDQAGTMYFLDDIEAKEPGLSGKDLAKAVLEAISQPVTNAICFNYSKTRQTERDLVDASGKVIDGKMTLFGDKILQSDDVSYERFVNKQDKIACRQESPYSYPPQAESEEDWLTLASGQTLTAYFSLYFDGNIGTSGSYGSESNATTYQMKNSNGFVTQKLKIAFNVIIRHAG